MYRHRWIYYTWILWDTDIYNIYICIHIYIYIPLIFSGSYKSSSRLGKLKTSTSSRPFKKVLKSWVAKSFFQHFRLDLQLQQSQKLWPATQFSTKKNPPPPMAAPCEFAPQLIKLHCKAANLFSCRCIATLGRCQEGLTKTQCVRWKAGDVLRNFQYLGRLSWNVKRIPYLLVKYTFFDLSGKFPLASLQKPVLSLQGTLICSH